MTEETKPATPPKPEPIRHEPIRLGEPGEHPLSVLLFSWMRSAFFFRFFMGVMAAVGAVMIGFEFIFIRKSYTTIDSLPGFFGVFGFIAFAAAVLSGWPLGRAMRRREDYYDTTSGEAGDDR
ncbi:MAG TPA: hypothetical protein VGO52_12225 [Hyphomonadaceae bacterium]|jgi:hypothetical protein|nr:hypothetical protein [Hyphomonadaceae bacterium]